MTVFREAIARRVEQTGSVLCIGLDSDMTQIPTKHLGSGDPQVTFNKAIIDATKDHAVCYKPNAAFYEARGAAGWDALAETGDYLRSLGIPSIIDAKRGDIGNTARMYAKAFFDEMDFDAVTVNPYMGEDAIAPFRQYEEKGVFVLCYTSNASRVDFQTQLIRTDEGADVPLYEWAARKIVEWDDADNLGAVLDPRILGWFASEEIPFAMEVAKRTESDKKGGHLARRDGRLMLREVAQCPKDDMESFQDIQRHHYFNTNNLWLDLDALARELDASSAGLPLPVIQNEKHVLSQDESSPRCYQLETAMGSAIECFAGSEAIVVPRERFAPVKTTSDLLSLWSDAYRLTEDARMVPVDAEANRVRMIELDARYFGHIDDLQNRFPEGAPSLAKCRRFSVVGDHCFGADVSVEGSVKLVNDSDVAVKIPSGTVLSGK